MQQQHFHYSPSPQLPSQGSTSSSSLYDSMIMQPHHHIQYVSGNNYCPSAQHSLLPLACATSASLVEMPLSPDAIISAQQQNPSTDKQQQKKSPQQRSKEIGDQCEHSSKSSELQPLLEHQQSSSLGSSQIIREGDSGGVINSSCAAPMPASVSACSPFSSYTSVIQQAHSLNYENNTTAAVSCWNNSSSTILRTQSSLNNNEFLSPSQQQTYPNPTNVHGYHSGFKSVLQPPLVLDSSALLMPDNSSFGASSCVQPPLPHGQIGNLDSSNASYQSGVWPGYYQIGAFASPEQQAYMSVGNFGENSFPYTSVDENNLVTSMFHQQPSQSGSLDAFASQAIENNSLQNFTSNGYGHSGATQNIFHLDYREPAVQQHSYVYDSSSLSAQPASQYLQLNSTQPLSYPPSLSTDSLYNASVVVPCAMPTKTSSVDGNLLPTPGGVIKNAQSSSSSLFFLEKTPSSIDAKTDIGFNGMRTSCSASTSGENSSSQRTRKAPKIKAIGGGISRLVTDRESLKHSARRSPPDSTDGSLKTRKSRSQSITKDSDDDKSMDEKEFERRIANNTRERIRVRDINAAFKELASLCCIHMPDLDHKSLTKLTTLIKAVELIPKLEEKVRQRNLDPKSCLNMKRSPMFRGSSADLTGGSHPNSSTPAQ